MAYVFDSMRYSGNAVFLSNDVSSGLTINCTLGEAAALGYDANVDRQLGISCADGTAVASGFTANVDRQNSISASLGTADAVGYTATIWSSLTDSEKIDLILDILSNRQYVDDVTGMYYLYADDRVTLLKTAYAWENREMTIPYRGRGLAALSEMTAPAA